MKHHLKAMLSVIVMTLAMQTTINAATNTQEVENFVSRFYTEVLGRTADTAGLADWTNRLVTGVSAGSDVATGFIFSDEFMANPAFSDDGAFVTILYKAFFNRDADTGGLNNWLGQLANGTSKKDVLDGFLFSQEFANLTEAYGIKAVPDGTTGGNTSTSGGTVEDFVKRFYSVVLGREADAGGLSDWVNRLNTKVATGADIATGFVFSDEFDETSKDNVTFLNVLYSAFFNRDADAGGLSGWLSQLEQGLSRLDVLNGFLYSQEFVNLCDAYGILAYSIIPDKLLSELIVGKTFYVVKSNPYRDGNLVYPITFSTDGFYDEGYGIYTVNDDENLLSLGALIRPYDRKGARIYSYDLNSVRQLSKSFIFFGRNGEKAVELFFSVEAAKQSFISKAQEFILTEGASTTTLDVFDPQKKLLLVDIYIARNRGYEVDNHWNDNFNIQISDINNDMDWYKLADNVGMGSYEIDNSIIENNDLNISKGIFIYGNEFISPWTLGAL